jgi:signal transduction histidine kinase
VAVAAGIVDAEMAGLRNALLVSLPLALLLSALGAWLVSGRALRPLTHLRETARRLRAADLHQRISPAGEDTEFAELIEVLNDMFERLQRSFQQARRFSADAAHELKTPLAILQGQLERAIARVEAGSVLQGELSGILDEVRRLSVISQKLLLLARADAGHLALALAPVPLSALLDDLVEDARMLAPSLQVTADIHPGLQVMADVGLLRQVLHNLIGNAVKYNLPAGWIRLSAVASATRAEVRIANACQEIPEGSRYRLFERFYRADAPHSRQVDGVGLGLSVSLEIARAHGGNLTLAAAGPDRAEFLLTLPLAPADTAPDHPGGHPHRDNGSPASV